MKAPLIACQNLEKAYGSDPLFSELSFGVAEGERLGLIGPNGSGKSTLLKLLAGIEKPDEGEVIAQTGTKIGYLAQSEDLPANSTVLQLLLEVIPADHRLERQYEIEDLAYSLGFQNLEQPFGQLSGGWRKRVSILRALLPEPDLLLMDEPTNHLDLEGILWLEQYLKKANLALVLISHDRSFLDRVSSRIMELSHHYPEGHFTVEGGYEAFLTTKAQYIEDQLSREQSLKNKVRRETEWLQRGPKARTTKARFRTDEAHRLKQELSTLKKLNQPKASLGIDFVATGRETKRLLEGFNLGKTLGEKNLFSKIDLKLSPGTRLGLMGPNGSGKTTLMKMLAGRLEPDTGNIKTAVDLRIVYFDQEREELDPTDTLKTALCPDGDSVVYQDKSIHVITWARRFLFAADQLDAPIPTLSGGEKARVLIAKLMLQPADILFLDEPTNDLDIPALEVLEESLQEFQGSVVLVTHDRFLLRQVATQILALDGQGGWNLFADYEQWEANQKPQAKTQTESKAAPAKKKSSLTFAEQKELKGMESKIQKAEAKLADLTQQMHDPQRASNHQALLELGQAVEVQAKNVNELYARWAELESKAEA